ncbi:2TM domain-containing protein [Tepidicaulis sp. LMO-SS28]|uniref:2TM domain-containing protein n=1 Tax=Tepidicaulis sp. LMO-SS28 TaxID=3447455 RepID=UPI003EE2D4CF
MLIRKLRLEKGLSQEQLASMAGISTRTLQRIERGAAASPETLKCLGAVLDISFSDLREETGMSSQTPHTASGLSEQEREAMEYVRDIKSFYTHAIQYAVVMSGLALLNLWTSPGFWWVIYPAIGWGIGVALHGLSVFEVFDLFGREWEKRQIARRLRRQGR